MPGTLSQTNRHPGRGVKFGRSTVALLLVFMSCFSAAGADGDGTDHYWQLGVGCYFGGLHGSMTEYDVAMFDWVYLCFGNIGATEETTGLLNRLLEINPRLKIVIRVWPIMGLGDCKENRYQATFLHYLYKPGVKEKLLAKVRQQVSVVLDNIDKPENVIGLTFLEELPLHFSGAPFQRRIPDGGVTWDLERFREEIEAERGKPLKWDDDTRVWWGQKWCQVLGEIHAEMKKASEGRLIFYYQQTNHNSLDMVPDGTPLSTSRLIPVRWADIIKPGLCDGFFAYPNNRHIWDRYARLARENDWLMFSQVSHPGGMRLCSWEECKALARTQMPQNLGYFFYCSGSCAADQAWNVDPGIPPGPEWNTRGLSIALHTRRHLALQGVGRDVLQRRPALGLLLDLPLDEAASKAFIYPRVIVENTRDESLYLDPQDAVARNVKVTLQAPEGFLINPEYSPPATLDMGDMLPGERRVASWWVSVNPGFDGKVAVPFVVTGTADGGAPTVIEAEEDTAIPFGQPHEIGVSGAEWMEAGYRLDRSPVQPRIIIEALRGVVRNPAISDGSATLRYEGALEHGTRLVLAPPDGARLFRQPLVDDDGASRADPEDATGFASFDEGYGVVGLSSGAPADPSVPLRITVAGKADGGAQSLMVLRFATAGTTIDKSVLVNRFSDQWREISQEITPPEGAVTLRKVYLYRLKTTGRIWYGPVKIERVDADPQGLDVSGALRGSFPSLSRETFRVFRYTDDNPASPTARARVRLEVPDE